MKNICILDYGLGNIRSLNNALKIIGYNPIMFSDIKNHSYNHLIIPGVGSFYKASQLLKNRKFSFLFKNNFTDIKILGICLGMQMLFTKGHEHGECKGLDLIPGEVLQIQKKMKNEKKLPVIGWRKTTSLSILKENDLKKKLDQKYFYYLHSYQAIPENKNNITAYYERGGSRINAAVAYGNIWGVQFHPEKSGDTGLEFLKGFCNLNINN